MSKPAQILVINAIDVSDGITGYRVLDDVDVVLNEIVMADGTRTIVTAAYKDTQIYFEVTFYNEEDYYSLRDALTGELTVSYYSARAKSMLNGIFYAYIPPYDTLKATPREFLIESFTVRLSMLEPAS